MLARSYEQQVRARVDVHVRGVAGERTRGHLVSKAREAGILGDALEHLHGQRVLYVAQDGSLERASAVLGRKAGIDQLFLGGFRPLETYVLSF